MSNEINNEVNNEISNTTTNTSTNKNPYTNPYNYTVLDKELSDIKDNSLIKDDKERIINWLMPDYSAGIDKGLEFISDDYYLMYVSPVWNLVQSGSKGCNVFINNELVFNIGTNYGEKGHTPIYIKPNEAIKITYDCSSVSEVCYPLMGRVSEERKE